jgi:hypothetical protein
MAPLGYVDATTNDGSRTFALYYCKAKTNLPLIFIDLCVDPATLCPYCDELLPSTPTRHLIDLLDLTHKKSYADPRPTNPQGLKAPLTTFIAVCQRHRFERVTLPEAERKKWPRVIQFEEVRRMVEKMKGRLEEIIMDADACGWDSSNDDDENGSEKETGPRGKCMFWKEIMKEIRKKGTQAVLGIGGQFASFEKTQPG